MGLFVMQLDSLNHIDMKLGSSCQQLESSLWPQSTTVIYSAAKVRHSAYTGASFSNVAGSEMNKLGAPKNMAGLIKHLQGPWML